MATPPGVSQLDASDFPALPDKEKLVRALNPFLGATATALKAGLTFKENFAGHIKVLEVTCPDDWVPLAGYIGAGNGWSVNTSSGRPVASVRKAVDGSITLRGTLQRLSGVPAAGSSVFTWPPGTAPAGRQTFGFATDTGPGASEVTTTAYLYFSGGTATYPLDEIRFTAADRAPLAWPTPVDFALPDSFTAKPGAVLVLRCEEMGSNAPVGAVSVDGWLLVASRAEESRQVVRLPRVNGLAPGYKYRLTLLVLPE